MVKYFFQSINGSISFVHSGDVEGLKNKINEEFENDKQEALRHLEEEKNGLKSKLDDAKMKITDDYIDKLENDALISRIEWMIAKTESEIEKVKNQKRNDLIFFELTPIEI